MTMHTRNQPARLALLADWIDENKLRLPDPAPHIFLSPWGGTELSWHLSHDDDVAREAIYRIEEWAGQADHLDSPGGVNHWAKWRPEDGPDLIVHYSAQFASGLWRPDPSLSLCDPRQIGGVL